VHDDCPTVTVPLVAKLEPLIVRRALEINKVDDVRELIDGAEYEKATLEEVIVVTCTATE